MRQAEDSEAKAAIARAASELIGDDDAVIFDNGTTAQAIAQRLAGRPITAISRIYISWSRPRTRQRSSSRRFATLGCRSLLCPRVSKA
ncbi:hypothetical protein [Corynebacterium sp. HMSC06G04]|uniref:hypothetical protein n=1 Tax=Corynebacterium sp. HMSC06G04 TaxID=1581126 RepID=UPI001FEEE186|nr:hypothetical protein [Corynebacterium sp. HMSC06G04]